MKAQQIIQALYSFFLGLVVVGFVAVGLMTFYPQSRYDQTSSGDDAWRAAVDSWSLGASIILLVCATVIFAVSLVLSERLDVVANGLLLGGVFTMIYAVGVSLDGRTSPLRFVVVAVALLVTVAVGYLKFVRGRRGAATAALAAAAGASASGVAPDVTERLVRVETKLDALRRALDG